ncbi:predicted protein [Postia placenta Mad-698-R]|nr:predicted protein [Postia placenta Mad-698-R]
MERVAAEKVARREVDQIIEAEREILREQRIHDGLVVSIDYLPLVPEEVPAVNSPLIAATAHSPTASGTIYRDSEPNKFGLFRSYLDIPVHDPEELASLDDASDSPNHVTSATTQHWYTSFGPQALHRQFFAPFLNASVFRLMSWFYSGSNMKSVSELDRLVNNVLLTEDFKIDELQGFSASREINRIDHASDEEGSIFQEDNGWHEASVKIPLPAEKVKNASESNAHHFEVKGLYHRSLIEVIKAGVRDIAANAFHFKPYRLFWRNPQHCDAPPERVYSELYNSDAMVEEYERIKAKPREPGDNLETGIIAIMLWSDSTHLTSFGTASLWPIYLFFGNLTKYARGKPTSFAAHHLAYIPSLAVV